MISSYPLFLRGQMIGYLYADSIHNRAGTIMVLDSLEFENRIDAVVFWDERIRSGAVKNLSPLEILEHWKGSREDPRGGAVPAEAELIEVSETQDLDRLANPGLESSKVDLEKSPYNQPDWGPLVSQSSDFNYRSNPLGPVNYRPVRLQGRVVGFLWASAEEHAFGYISHPRSGPEGESAQRWWEGEAKVFFVSYFTADQALNFRVGMPEDPVGGKLIEQDEELTAESLEKLKEIIRP